MLDFLGFSMGRLEVHMQTNPFQRYNRLYMLIIHWYVYMYICLYRIKIQEVSPSYACDIISILTSSYIWILVRRFYTNPFIFLFHDSIHPRIFHLGRIQCACAVLVWRVKWPQWDWWAPGWETPSSVPCIGNLVRSNKKPKICPVRHWEVLQEKIVHLFVCLEA